MSESKTDPLTATGRYRVRIGEGGRPATPPKTPSPPPVDQRHWLAQAQKPNARHSAITRSLFSWSSYRSWADKMKTGWDKDK